MRCEYCVSAGYGPGPHGASPSCSLTLLEGTTMPFKLHPVTLILLLNALVSGMRRGPHHPHGQSSKHNHHRPRGGQSLTGESQVLHDIKHIEEDSKVLTSDAISRMTPEELEFHYFSAHDFDRNSKLDGLELLKAVYHTVDYEDHDAESASIEPETNDLEAYIELVDRTLEVDDMDGDGYVSYAEYRAARARSKDQRTHRVLADN
ncbi:Multiple coagulation factor deficiency protein 2-like [Papilio machaon]|uniref:Multiple coagulation factor deficiency protein 2-like n=1 Tax=Papilio machaon TaxID=76193 RepID=A0A194QM06_PAPMA|nr:Multiple coagulation factor deficiency protein 2-like [Papilio machaon]